MVITPSLEKQAGSRRHNPVYSVLRLRLMPVIRRIITIGYGGTVSTDDGRTMLVGAMTPPTARNGLPPSSARGDASTGSAVGRCVNRHLSARRGRLSAKLWWKSRKGQGEGCRSAGKWLSLPAIENLRGCQHFERSASRRNRQPNAVAFVAPENPRGGRRSYSLRRVAAGPPNPVRT